MNTVNRFPLLGERLCIDLVNTHRLCDGRTVDLLDSRAALAHWLRAQAGRIRWHGQPDAADLVALQATRDAITPLLRAAAAHVQPPQQDITLFNTLLARPRPVPRLDWTEPAKARCAVATGDQRAVLEHQILDDALTLLTGTEAGRVRQCAHPGCILLFVANHPRRRWCSATTCGNRARVARHYRTRKARP